jgi:hypothetical protein
MRHLLGLVIALAACELQPVDDASQARPESGARLIISSGGGFSVVVGEVVKLTAVPVGSNGEPLSVYAISWQVTPAGVASVSADGLVTGLAPGAATLTAIAKPLSGSSELRASVDVTVTGCGDAACLDGETCASCAQDCGACARCGDAVCNGGETCSSCVGDCGACGQADLVVTAFSWSPSAPIAGDVVSFTVTVKNNGTGPTPAGVVLGVGFKIGTATSAWSDTHTDALAPGDSVDLITNRNWAALSGTARPGRTSGSNGPRPCMMLTPRIPSCAPFHS